MSFCLRPNTCKKCGKPLTMFEGWVCLECEKAEQEPYICDTCKHKDDGWDTEPCDGCCGNHSGYEPCDDAISREAVIDAICFGISNIRAFNDTTMIRFYERENEALKKAIERVNKLPSVTQKSGKWDNNKNFYARWRILL